MRIGRTTLSMVPTKIVQIRRATPHPWLPCQKSQATAPASSSPWLARNARSTRQAKAPFSSATRTTSASLPGASPFVVEMLALARYPNVAIKLSAAPT